MVTKEEWAELDRKLDAWERWRANKDAEKSNASPMGGGRGRCVHMIPLSQHCEACAADRENQR